MQLDVQKMQLTPATAASAPLQKAHADAVTTLLTPERRRSNLVGVGHGIKWSNGQPTGTPAILALVTQKVDEADLSPDDVIPKQVGGVPTDVLAIGQPFAGQAQPQEVAIELLAKRVRPASGGYSVGHYAITAGTLSTCVYDLGAAMPGRYYVLSNNHVLANSNNAVPGDAILQPGPYDGGTNPADKIAKLTRFERIMFFPPTPLASHNNLIDAAIAEGDFHDLNREIYWVGYLRGWLPRTAINVGLELHKTGRTTNYTTGRVTAINATVDVGYGGGKVARFRDQIITTPMSAPGDSGSMVSTRDGNLAVGLLFAGSNLSTILNQIQHVRTLLGVEIA